MPNFNKVIKVLNMKSASSWQLTSARAQSTDRDNAFDIPLNELSRTLDCAFPLQSIANSLQILYLKPIQLC